MSEKGQGSVKAKEKEKEKEVIPLTQEAQLRESLYSEATGTNAVSTDLVLVSGFSN